MEGRRFRNDDVRRPKAGGKCTMNVSCFHSIVLKSGDSDPLHLRSMDCVVRRLCNLQARWERQEGFQAAGRQAESFVASNLFTIDVDR